MPTLRFAGPLRTDIDTTNALKWTPSATKEVNIGSQITSIIQDVGFSFTDIMGEGDEKMYSLVCAIFDKTSELTRKTEQRIRELLQDHHSTFSLFTRGMDVAFEKARTGEKVSVDLYIQDIGNPDFVETLKNAKLRGIKPESLILEIRPDDCGVIDSTVIKNLGSISDLGFDFSLNDFVMKENELRADNLEKVIGGGIFPSYVKIAKSVYEKMRAGSIKIRKRVQDIFRIIRKKGVKILIDHLKIEGKIDDTTEGAEKHELGFFHESNIEKEGIYDIDGELCAQEGLIRFGEDISVPQGLEKLKELGMTKTLMHKMLMDSIPDVLNNKRRTLNVYIKDLGDKDFREEVENAIRFIPFAKRKGLIFEILEERYGAISYQVLYNIRFLQEQGFAIAIDDLFLGDNPRGMSKEILEILHEEGITPEYIKIDGKHVEAIRKGELPPEEIAHIREIIGHFSLLPEKPIFILEWIQDTEHALQVLDTIGMPGAKFWFQGRNIKKGRFGLSLPEKAA